MESNNENGEAMVNFINQEFKERLPFANLSGDNAAPEWTKQILIQKHSIKDAGKCLIFLNELNLHQK